jgi:hypothetical protein
MDDVLWNLLPLATGAVGYLGGIATDPLKKLLTDYLRIKEIRAGLVGEIANTYEQYQFVIHMERTSSMLVSVQNSIRFGLLHDPRIDSKTGGMSAGGQGDCSALKLRGRSHWPSTRGMRNGWSRRWLVLGSYDRQAGIGEH